MGIPILGKDGLYIETGPWTLWWILRTVDELLVAGLFVGCNDSSMVLCSIQAKDRWISVIWDILVLSYSINLTVAKPTLKLGHRSVITSQSFMWVWLLVHVAPITLLATICYRLFCSDVWYPFHYKDRLAMYRSSIIKIRWSWDRFTFMMEFVRTFIRRYIYIYIYIYTLKRSAGCNLVPNCRSPMVKC